MNNIKTYFLVPGWDFPPGSIKLGTLILNPSRPQRALNSNPIPITSLIYSTTKSNFSSTLRASKTHRIGLWAQFLQIFGLGAEFSVQFDSEQIDEYAFASMKTEWFVPSKEFVEKSVQAPEVVDMLEMVGYKKPLYLITGLKTVEGASVTTVRGKGKKVVGKAGLDGTATGVPVSGGPEGEYRIKGEEVVRFENQMPIVFAFQLSRVVIKEKEVVQKEFTKGALLGVGGGQSGVDVDMEWDWEKGGECVIPVSDEDGEENCACVLSTPIK